MGQALAIHTDIDENLTKNIALISLVLQLVAVKLSQRTKNQRVQNNPARNKGAIKREK